MYKSLILFFSIALLLSSCSLSVFRGYRHDINPDFTSTSWFKSDTGHFLLNTKIDLMKNHFSGLMVVKPEENGSYRVVMLTEVGLKVFDFELGADGDTRVHYIMDPMNRKILIKTLSSDLGFVIMNDHAGDPIHLYQKKTGDHVIKYINNGKRNYYHLKTNALNPYYGHQTGCITSTSRVFYYGSSAGIDSVILAHDNIRLSIKLYSISNDPVDE